MSGLAELVQAVREAPEDLSLRLVIADWFQEHGDPRGELIAAACRLAGRGLSPATRGMLTKRVDALMQAHEHTWARPVSDLGVRWTFRRGFVHSMHGDVQRILEGWQSVIEVEPVVHVELRDCDADAMEQLAGSELLRAILHLTIRGTIGDEGVRHLVAAPGFGTLERLNLKSTGLTDDAVERLANVAGFRPRRLTLTDNEITDDGARALVESEVLQRIECLFLARTQLGDDGVSALAQSPHLGQLRELGLGSLEELTSEGAGALAQSPHLTSLQYLEVDSCWELGESDIDALRQRVARVRSDYGS